MWEDGSFVVKPGDEDIHTANERMLKVVNHILTAISNDRLVTVHVCSIYIYPWVATPVKRHLSKILKFEIIDAGTWES